MSQSDEQYVDSLKKRYAQATRKERSKILDEFVEVKMSGLGAVEVLG